MQSIVMCGRCRLLILLLMICLVIHGCASGPLFKGAPEKWLFSAVDVNDVKSAKEKLAEGANVNARDAGGKTPLMWAAVRGHLAMVQLLVEKGAEVNVKEPFIGNTPLHKAAEEQKAGKAKTEHPGGFEVVTYIMDNRDRPEIVKYLIAHGAEVNATNQHGETPLLKAVKKGRKATVEVLLKSGAALESQGGVRGDTPLMIAAQEGELEMVQLLLDKGAKVNGRGKDQGTALMTAGYAQHPEVVALLLSRGADVNARNQYGMTALLIAVQAKPDALTHKVALLLLDAGADVKAVNDKGETALMLATKNGNNKTVELLSQPRAKR
jgi:ankyrin repeat protein